jgi:hypothetical protein
MQNTKIFILLLGFSFFGFNTCKKSTQKDKSTSNKAHFSKLAIGAPLIIIKKTA